MEFFLATLSGFLLPAALFTYKNYVNERSKRRKLEQEIKKEQEEKMRTLTSGVCMLIRMSIIDYHKKYMHRGSIPLYAIENAKTMYTVYNTLTDENGIHEMMEELGDLPIDN